MAILRKKICLLGSFGVGKSSLIRRFVHDSFDETYLSTIGVNISQKRLVTSGQKKNLEYELFIWDIEGHEKFSEVIDSYYTGAAGAILVCDLTREDSLKMLEPISSRFKTINPDAALVFCANKTDLIDAKQPLIKESKKWSAEQHIDLIMTSAKEGTGVNEAFAKLAQLL